MKILKLMIITGLIIGLVIAPSPAGNINSKADELKPISTIMPTPIPTAMPTITPIPKKEVKIEYDPPEVVEDWFTDSEIEMIVRLVEAEATAGNIEDKMNVANVVYNRYLSEDFPDTIEEVVFQRTGGYYQFSCIGDNRYYEVEITEETIEAVHLAFTEKDTTDGALFFCNQRDVKNLSFKKWFKSLTYIMTDDLGQSYYK